MAHPPDGGLALLEPADEPGDLDQRDRVVGENRYPPPLSTSAFDSLYSAGQVRSQPSDPDRLGRNVRGKGTGRRPCDFCKNKDETGKF